MGKDLKNISQVLGVGFGNVLFTFFQAILLTRLLSIDDRGHVQLFIVSSTIFSSFFISGAGNTIAFCIRNGKKKGYVAVLVTLSAILLMGLCLKYIFDNSSQYAVLFIVQVVALCMMQLTVELLKIQASLKYYKIYSFSTPLIFLVITVFVFISENMISADNAIRLTILSNSISSLIGLFFIAKVMNEKDVEGEISKSEFFQYYIKQYALQLFGIVTNNMDKYLIGNFIGVTALGLYSSAAAFNTLPLKYYNVLSDYLFSGYINKKNNEKIVILTAVIGGGVGCIISFFMSEYLILIAFGERYLSSHVYLPYIIVNVVISGIAWVLTQKALISGNQILIIIRQLLGLSVFAAIFFMSEKYGLWGAIGALITGSIIRLIISILFFVKIKL
ncbi:polysaccharide biosynthesis protein [Raoultella terrigena]|nr:oligosaccharide flippase family protein [Raoultella terrigena]BAT24285.1 flippase [Klebsiella sp. 889]VUC77838.1 polysaccharide biosynthesis protein [Raoultella terrigena]